MRNKWTISDTFLRIPMTWLTCARNSSPALAPTSRVPTDRRMQTSVTQMLGRARMWWLLALVAIATVVHGQGNCRTVTTLGCFLDNGDGNRTFALRTPDAEYMTQETCAAMCNQLGSPQYAAVEYKTQCFCGNAFAYQQPEAPSDCRAMMCPGNTSQACGGANRMLVFTYSCDGPPQPNAHACMDSASRGLPFCDTRLPLDARLDDLMGRLTQDEKQAMIGADTRHTPMDACSAMTGAVARLGIPGHLQIVETNSAVASLCVAPNRCATEWVGPTGLAASFNRSLWRGKGEALSDEMRAFNNLGWSRGYTTMKSSIGLLGYGPNINIVRDPRFGRNSELPSEDPYLTGTYATEYVRGCQEGRDSRYVKMLAGLKHFACYSVETARDRFIPNVTTFDIWDTYLAQYAMAFDPQGGNAHAVMCSYSGLNGVPSCANDWLINKVVRGKWKRPDVYVGTDCGAISNMVHGNKYARDDTDAAAKSLNGGSDVNMGDSYFPPASNGGNGALANAIRTGQTTMTQLNTVVRRVLSKRFLTGQFDPIDNQPYTRIGPEVINSTAHQQLNLEAALQSLVLLRNNGNTLPFRVGRKLAVVGPHVFSTRDLMEDYKGDNECYGGGDACVRTIAEVFTTMNTGGQTTVAKGVDLDSQDQSGIQAALDAVDASEIVVLCLGLGNTQEHEGLDRTSITLPGLQEKFGMAVINRNKPTVLVLINGGMLDIGALAGPATTAIIEAFYPSMPGPQALFMSIFGQANRWGKMPVTIYDSSFTKQQSMTDFDMTKAPGRTYRYFTGNAMWFFGWGLSYSTFAWSCTNAGGSNATSLQCHIANQGPMAGDQVLMVFHRVSDDIRKACSHPVPLKQLAEFERFSLAVSAPARQHRFTVPWSRFALTNRDGDKILYPGQHFLDVSDGMLTQSLPVTIPGTLPVVIDQAV